MSTGPREAASVPADKRERRGSIRRQPPPTLHILPPGEAVLCSRGAPHAPMTAPTTRMPAEWAPHAATWIAWPHNPEDWPGKFRPIPWVYAEIARHLSRVEDVHILVNNVAAERSATSVLLRGGANLARTHFHHWPTDRVWLRDSRSEER